MNNQLRNCDDRDCLARFVTSQSEEAFGDLVTQHLPMVFATARRQLNGDSALAEDIAQQAFVDLARKATRIHPEVVLGGWLYRHTVFLSRKAVRSESRRRTREAIAASNAATDSTDDNAAGAWRKFAPLVDEAMSKLRPWEREAIVLRYLEGQPLRAVGASLGVSEDTARKRVSRAIEKLRSCLARRGVPISVSSLTVALGSEVTNAAVPAALASSIVAEALKEGAATGTGFIAGTLVPHVVAAALGVALTVVAGATLDSTETSGQRKRQASPKSEQTPGGGRTVRATKSARSSDRIDKSSSPVSLSAIVRKVRDLASRPATHRTDDEIHDLLATISPSELAAAAEAFSGEGNSRAVWHLVMPSLFKHWAEVDLVAAFDFFSVKLLAERGAWYRLLRNWKADPSNAGAAREWFLRVVNGESGGALREPSGWMTSTGAELGLKTPSRFEEFIASLPSVPASGIEGYLIPETIRNTTLGRVYKLPLEEQHAWTEALANPEESSRVISTMLNKILSSRNQSPPDQRSSLLEVADWAWEALPTENRDTNVVPVLRRLSAQDVGETIAWYQARADDSALEVAASQLVRERPGSNPRVQLAWADTVSDPLLREDLAAGVFRRWCRDPDGWHEPQGGNRTRETPREYLSNHELAPARRARFESILAKP